MTPKIPITINKTVYNVPQSWEACTNAQFVSLASLVQNQWNINATFKDKKAKPKQIEQAEQAKRSNELNILYLLLGAPMKTFQALTAEQTLDLMPALAWINKEAYPLKVKLKQFNHRNTVYSVHKTALKGMWFKEYLLIEGALKQLIKDQNPRNAAIFVARISKTPTNRQPAANSFRDIAPELAFALLFQYLGALEALGNKFPDVFNSNTQSSAPGAWFDVIDTILAPKFGNDIRAAKQATLYDAMGIMNNKAKAQKKLAQQQNTKI